ncbi:S-adenosyl-L-methionine-dependent methyltransferase [Lichtheimia hyalospora FSU 10163]|nr:S-adenosyl-L-methionine-dependent methyltransferase [Lichtheimia hyalospora FSU 10163]
MAVPSINDKINYIKVTISDEDDNTRALKWLTQHYRHIVQSKECCKRSFRRQEITVNGEPIEETRILHAGDVIEVRYDRARVEQEKLRSVPVDIRYQDEHIAIVWKAPGQSFGIFERALPYALSLARENYVCWSPYSLQKAASGLLVIATSDHAKQFLSQAYQQSEDFNVTMRVICHGKVPADLMSTLTSTNLKPLPVDPTTVVTTSNQDEEEEEEEEDNDNLTRSASEVVSDLRLVQITRSNNADYLSTLDLDLHTPFSSMAIRSLLFHQAGYPIVGNSTYTKYLKSSRDKGLCMSVMRLQLLHPTTHETMTWNATEPEKFELLRAREQKFWRRKLDEKLEALKKSGRITENQEQLDQVESGATTDKPLAYMLGEKTFCGLCFKVSEACLIPRPSTETLVNAAVAILLQESGNNNKQQQRVLDIGTGCGNLLLSIMHQTTHHINVQGLGIDISKDALAVARENQASLGLDHVTFTECDMGLLDCSKVGLFDVVVCNPPYLNETIVKSSFKHREDFNLLLQEPATALFAGDDGYEWYTVLSKVAPKVMHRHAKLVLECGKGMMDRVKLIMTGWKTVEVRKDKQGWDRCLVLELQ